MHKSVNVYNYIYAVTTRVMHIHSLPYISLIQNIVNVTRRCGISHEKYKAVKSFAGTLKNKRIKFYCLEPVMERNLDHSCK
jgi:hypothetical protein